MIPLALRITNFRRFTKTQEFVFPQEPGLYFMQGINEAEPRLEGNGAGKTTIWEALTWCIYGKTSKGLKAGDVNTWGVGKNTRVEFDFISPSGEECTLVRTWKPNSWLLQSTANPKDMEDLDKAKRNAFMGWLGLDYSPWLQCVLMAQNKPMFLDLEATAKASLFSDVMGLDKWMDFATAASKRAAREDSEIRSLERSESELKGRLDQVGSTDFKASHDEWEAKRAQRLERIGADYELALEHSYTKEDLKAAEATEAKARDAYRIFKEEGEVAITAFRALERELAEIDKDLVRAEQNLKHAETHLGGIEGNAACAQCGQKLDTKTRAKHLAEAQAKYAKAFNAETKLSAAYEQKRKEVIEGGEATDGLRVSIETAQKRLRAAEDATADARRAKLIEDKLLDSLDDEAEDLKAQVNPFDAMARDAEASQAKLRQALRDVRADLDDGREKHSIYSFWVRGFKEIRLQEIAEALTEFEIEVNSAVAALGLLDWELQFQVDRETAKGTLQRGFSTTVLSPHNDSGVPWEAWSGGEGQRLRVSANMGLADLIRMRTGTTLNLEVWDEPTQGLSPQGVTDLLEALSQRARHEGRVIFVVDHRTYAYGGFAGTATIIKTPSGSRIRTTWV